MEKIWTQVESEPGTIVLNELKTLRETCYLDESFMSRGRWKQKDRGLYVRSVLRGMALTPFILADVKKCLANATDPKDIEYFENLANKGYAYVTCDSNNRGTTMYMLMNDQTPFPTGSYEIGRKLLTIDNASTFLKDLSESDQTMVGARYVNVVYITKATRRELSDIFDAVNRGVTQNAQEMRQSWYTNIAQPIRDLATKHETKIANDNKVYTETQVNRRYIDEMIVDLCIFSKYGVDTAYNKTIRDAMYKESSPIISEWKTVDRLLKRISVPEQINNPRSIFINMMLRLHIEKSDDLKIADDAAFDNFVYELDKKWTLAKNAPQMGHSNGNTFAYKNAGRRQQEFLAWNLKIFFEEVMKTSGLIISVDPERLYTPEQKYELWINQNGVSTVTGSEIPLLQILDSELWQADHIVPHSKGGETTIENGQLIETYINRQKSDTMEAA